MTSLSNTVTFASEFSSLSSLSNLSTNRISVSNGNDLIVMSINANPLSPDTMLSLTVSKVVPVNANSLQGSDGYVIADYFNDLIPEGLHRHGWDTRLRVEPVGTKKGAPDQTIKEFYDRGMKYVKCLNSTRDDNRGDLITLLWHDYSLVIFTDMQEQEEKWKKICDISGLITSLRENLDTMDLASEERALLFPGEEGCKVSAVAFAWSSMFSLSETSSKRKVPTAVAVSDKQTLCAVALKTRHIILWKVAFPVEDIRSFQLAKILSPSLNICEELFFLPVRGRSVVLCEGSKSGHAFLHRFEIDSSSNLICIGAIDLWPDSDRIAVTTFVWDSKIHDPLIGRPLIMHAVPWLAFDSFAIQEDILLAAKGSYLVYWKIDWSENRLSVASTNVHSVNSKYSVCNLQWNESHLLVATCDGFINQCRVNDGSISSEPLLLPWSTKAWKINGMLTSKNNVYLIVAVNPVSYYCNLKLRRPALVHYISLKSTKEVTDLVLSHTGSFCDILDALGYLKLEIAREHPWPEAVLSFIDPKSNSVDPKADSVDPKSNSVDSKSDRQPYSPYQLKLLRYLLQLQLLYIRNSDTSEKDKVELKIKIATVEDLILRGHIKHTFQWLLSHNKKNMPRLTDTENQSLSLMVDYLNQKQSADDREMTDEADLLSRTTKLLQHRSEKCGVCKNDVALTSPASDGCCEGHIFARCCQTLILCHKVPYRVCMFCKSMALAKSSSDNVTLFRFLQTDLCIYCDGRLC